MKPNHKIADALRTVALRATVRARKDLVRHRVALVQQLEAHLGTKDLEEVERRIEKGDRRAALVYDAMVYQVSKQVGAMAAALKGLVDAILLTGDVESAAESDLVASGQDLRADVLKVPHHGARSSLDQDWLRRIHPQYAIISVGSTNPYGHPAPAVLETYHNQGIRVYRTDRDGAVWVQGRLSSTELTVTSMRELVIQPVDVFTCRWRCEYHNWHRLVLASSSRYR